MDFLNLLDNQSSWIYVIDPKDYQMLFINKNQRNMSQLKKECLYQVVMQRETLQSFVLLKT